MVNNDLFNLIVDLIIQLVTFRKKESVIRRKETRRYMKYMMM